MKETEKAWLAAMIDGEGCISIRCGKAQRTQRVSASYGGVLVIGNTCRALLERCVEITGVGHIHTMKRQSERHKVCYQWNLGSKQTVDVLHQVHPYLIAKQRQADVVFQLDDINQYSARVNAGAGNICDSGTQIRRERLKQVIHALNRRGGGVNDEVIEMPVARTPEPTLFVLDIPS